MNQRPDHWDSFGDEIYSSKGGILGTTELIPPPKEIRARARDVLKSPAGSDDFDTELRQILEEEYRIYKQVTNDLGLRFLRYVVDFCSENPGKYPNLDRVAEKLLSNEQEDSKLIEIIDEELVTTIRHFSFAFRQGGKTRAGQSLESAIEFLLGKRGFRKGVHFDVQIDISGDDEVDMDFIFPADPEYWQVNPGFTVTTACMTSINDRKRIAKQQVQKNTQRRVFTALGASQFDDMVSVLSKPILDDFQRNGMRVAAMSNVLQRWDGHSAVCSYEALIKDLTVLKKHWDDWYMGKEGGFHVYLNGERQPKLWTYDEFFKIQEEE